MFDAFSKTIEKVSKIVNWGSIIIMPMMMTLVTLDVVLRYIFNAPIKGAQVIEGFMFLFVSFCGFAACWLKDGHVRMKLFTAHTNPKIKGLLNALAAACGAFMFIILTWWTAKESIAAAETGAVTMSLQLPEYPFYISMTILSGLFVIQLLASLIDSIRKIVGR